MLILCLSTCSTYRLANMLLRIQMREGMVVFVSLLVSLTLIMYVNPNNCASQIITALGFVPLQVRIMVCHIV